MHHFFVKNHQISGTEAYILEDDYNHAANVLRLSAGETILLSDEDGQDYLCSVEEILPETERIRLSVLEEQAENHELPARVWLFQGLPKSDKLELIIQKATELGVSDIVPVDMKNCVVRLDGKKAEAKQKRWQAIAESAAKQSKRSCIPTVHPVTRFTDAVRMAESFAVKILPYEAEDGITGMCEAIVSFLPGRDIAVMIGPEGGFDHMEVKLASNRGFRPVSLGKRILRTETAAIAVLAMIMIRLEIVSEMDLEIG
ncbi:MAG: 16S rRNA (uracil(1498)-N(3))-methyltransferase [Eubacteriales bacterium]|nr:16S rRNA (uracil(1498)-N(3))-methyltransferase [Eubacteriales bacterium]